MESKLDTNDLTPSVAAVDFADASASKSTGNSTTGVTQSIVSPTKKVEKYVESEKAKQDLGVTKAYYAAPSSCLVTQNEEFNKGQLSPKNQEKKCLVCGMVVRRPDYLFRHTLQHYKGLVFFCRKCFRLFGYYKCALDHYLTHDALTRNNYGVGLLCNVCGFVESTDHRWEILNHFGQYCDSRSAGSKTFECKAIWSNLRRVFRSDIDFGNDNKPCDAKFSDAESLCQHVEMHLKTVKTEKTSDGDASRSRIEGRQPEVRRDVVSNHRQCKVCGKGYSRQDFFFRHVLNHFEGVLFTCKLCTANFRCYDVALGHFKTHCSPSQPGEGVCILCHICGFTRTCFNNILNIVDHFWKHHEDDPNSALSAHQKAVNYASAYAEARKQEYQNVQHLKNPDSINCDLCDASFSGKEEHFQHFSLHLSRVILFCRVCFETFDRYDGAMDHIRRHKFGTFPIHSLGLICHQCGLVENFRKYSKVIDHLNLHINNKSSADQADQVVFECKNVIASLRYFSKSEIEFETGTGVCDAKFADVESLCAHVKHHLKTPKAHGRGSEVKNLEPGETITKIEKCTSIHGVNSFAVHNSGLQNKTGKTEESGAGDCSIEPRSSAYYFQQKNSTSAFSGAGSAHAVSRTWVRDIVPLCTSPKKIIDPKAGNPLVIMPKCDKLLEPSVPNKLVLELGNQASDAGRPVSIANPKSAGHHQLCTKATTNVIVREIIPASVASPKSVRHHQLIRKVSTVESTNASSNVCVREVIPVLQNSPKPENNPEPSAPKRLVLEVENLQSSASIAGRPSDQPRIKIFTCCVCKKQFVTEKFYRLHQERSGH